LVGLITAADLLAALDQALDEDIDENEPADDGDSSDEQLARLGRVSAIEIANPEPVRVTPETPISEIVALMREERIHRVLVCDGAKPVGIVTTLDLIVSQGGG